MTLNRKTKPRSRNSNDDGFFSITNEKKKKIIGILLLVSSFFLFFSIVSFSKYDEALLGSFFHDLVSGKTKNPANWLGVVGAHFSTFLVKQTLGYFSIAFPAILFFWGIAFFKKIKFKTIIYTSNFILLAAIILASLFGILKSIFGESTLFEHLSGFVG